MNKPYPKNAVHLRKDTLYGVSLHEASGQHFCFNRDYEHLPVELPAYLLEEVRKKAERVEKAYFFKRHDMGNMVGNERAEEWATYFVFSDRSAPDWS